jgi:hypothetical protein
MASALDKSTAQKTFAFVAKALLVTLIASFPLAFAVLTGRF